MTYEHSLALHLMIRHGVDVLADAVVDECASAAFRGAHACKSAYARARWALRLPLTVPHSTPLDLRALR